MSWNEYSIYLLDTVNQVSKVIVPHLWCLEARECLWTILLHFSDDRRNSVDSDALLFPLGQSRNPNEGLVVFVDLKKYLV